MNKTSAGTVATRRGVPPMMYAIGGTFRASHGLTAAHSLEGAPDD